LYLFTLFCAHTCTLRGLSRLDKPRFDYLRSIVRRCVDFDRIGSIRPRRVDHPRLRLPSHKHGPLDASSFALRSAAAADFDLVAYRLGFDRTYTETRRAERIVRIGAIQNCIHAPTDAPVDVQYRAIEARIRVMIGVSF
jgi:hypothetical protein